MMGIVINHHLTMVTRFLEPELKTTLRTHERGNGFSHHTARHVNQSASRHSSNGVLDIDGNRHAQVDVANRLPRSHQVKDNLSVVLADVGSVEVALVAAIGVSGHLLAHPGFQGQSRVNDE